MGLFSKKKFCIVNGVDDTSIIVNLDNLSSVSPYRDDNGVVRGYSLNFDDGSSVICFGEFKEILCSLLNPAF